MHDFYFISQMVGVVILGGLVIWSGYVLKPKDLEETPKAHKP